MCICLLICFPQNLSTSQGCYDKQNHLEIICEWNSFKNEKEYIMQGLAIMNI